MDFRNNAKSSLFDSTDLGRRSGLPETAPSAAWQAAQDAFAVLEKNLGVAPTVVILRKSRIPAVAPKVVEQIDPIVHSSAAAAKPRVFRIETLGNKGQAGKPICTENLASAPAPLHGVKQKRIRRRRAVQNPGPVFQRYLAKSAVDLVIPGPISTAPLSRAEAADLNVKLAQVSRTLEEIQSAADFELTDLNLTAALAWTAFCADLRRIRSVADGLSGR